MPIHVQIRINEHLIEELHIGRTTSNASDMLPDSVNTYVAVLGVQPIGYDNWMTRGKEFTHRYGDRVLVCVQKALDSLIEKPKAELETNEQEISADNLRKQLEGFLDALPYPKSKDAHKAKSNAEDLLDFILETFEMGMEEQND